MAIYAVKYNPSLTYIPGATQVGTLAVAIGDVDYTTGGWIAGVSDDNGYVIYSDTSSLNLAGRTTGGGTGTASSNMPTFYRSQFKIWIGLYPFIIYHYLFKGYNCMLPLNKSKIITKPHKGQLLYELREYCSFKKFNFNTKLFLKI